MRDPIERQDAIDAVKCGALSAAMVYGRTDEGRTALYETVKAIKAIPSAQPEQQWIPCSERLPKDVQIGDEYPIVIFCTKEKTYTGFYEYYLGERWWTADGDSVVDGVIAWRELPEPYKERREE